MPGENKFYKYFVVYPFNVLSISKITIIVSLIFCYIIKSLKNFRYCWYYLFTDGTQNNEFPVIDWNLFFEK